MLGVEAPALTIIVVNWNTRDMTIDCIRSIYEQTHEVSFELIVVDNGSQDQSAEAIRREYPQVRLLDETVNHGFAVANNMAAAVARGRRLLLLNSDTVVLDRAIDRLWTFSESCPEAGIWGGRTVWGDGSLNPTSAWVAQSPWSVACFAFGLTRLFPKSNFFNVEAMGGWGRDSAREVDIVTGCFLMIDTDLWRRLDGFDVSYFMYGEEADLCLRAKDIGARPMVTPEATIVHYGGGSAITRVDPAVRVLKGKIQLAYKRNRGFSASAIRWLYLVAAVVRAAGFSVVSLFKEPARKQAWLWRETLARREEWFGRQRA